MDTNRPKPPAEGKAHPERLHAETLFKGNKEVLIDFGGEVYRLRITKNEKLILTK